MPGTRDQGNWSGKCMGGHLVWEAYESSSMGLFSPGLRKVSNFNSPLLWQPLPRLTPAKGSGLSLSPNPGLYHSLNFTKGNLLSPCAKGQREKSCAGPGFPLSAPFQPHFIHSSSTALQEKTLGWWLPWISPELVGRYRMYWVGKSIGYLLFQDVGYRLRIPSLFPG